MKYSGRIVFIIALMYEARPIIDAFKLKKNIALKPFGFYQKDNISLCVTGVGGGSVISAISFLAGAGFVDKETVMINYGIAGARDIDVGSFFEINKISNSNGQAYFPVKLKNFGFVEAEVITSDSAVLDYPERGVVDMEAYSFFQTSLKFVSMEQIWVAKVVSDNLENQIDIGDKKFVTELLFEHIEKIKIVVEFYDSLSGSLKEVNSYPEEYYRLVGKIKFSFNEKIQLKKLVMELLNKGIKVDVDSLMKCRNSKQVFARLVF